MRKLAFALSTALVTAPVLAVQMEGTYFNVNVGAALQPNITYHATNNSATTGNQFLATQNKSGGTFDLAYGYQTEDLRAEASVIYLQNKLKSAMMQSTNFDIRATPNPGNTKVIGLMANGMYDFDSESDFTPYIGFGIGGVRISQNIKGFPSFSGTITTSGDTLTVNNPAVTTTTTSGSSTTTTTTTYTQTVTTTTTSVVNNVTSVSPGVTALTGILPSPSIEVSPPQSTSFSSADDPPGTSAPFGPSVTNLTNVASYANGSHLQFAYQTIIGVSYRILDDIKLSADYRYLRALSTTFTVMDAGVPTPMAGSYSNHRFMLGMSVFF